MRGFLGKIYIISLFDYSLAKNESNSPNCNLFVYIGNIL